jgi:ABC-type sulfate transport system permease component
VTAFRALLVVALAVALVFLTLPIVAIFVDTTPGELIASLGDPTSRDALVLSLQTTAIAVAIIVVVGTPAAYALAMREFPGKQVVVTLVELPLVLPPAVAGIGLLAALGPQGVLGEGSRRSTRPGWRHRARSGRARRARSPASRSRAPSRGWWPDWRWPGAGRWASSVRH